MFAQWLITWSSQVKWQPEALHFTFHTQKEKTITLDVFVHTHTPNQAKVHKRSDWYLKLSHDIPFIIKADYHETCKLHLNKSQLAKTKLAGLALWEMHAWGSLHMEFKLMASPDNIISQEEHVWTKTYRPLEMRACSCHDAHCLSNWQWNFFRMHLVYWQLW